MSQKISPQNPPSPSPGNHHRALADVLKSRLIFVTGKGGTGKSAVSQAIARHLATQAEVLGSGTKKILWVTFEDPTLPPNGLETIAQGKFYQLQRLNIDSMASFEEYIGLKLGLPALAGLFVGNKVIRYLAKAAPGLHEMVLLGKLWHERNHYDQIVADMPSSGYTVTMIQSTQNFSKLFSGGPLSKDATAMIETFLDPVWTSFLIVSLSEEMPLVESLELSDQLRKILPGTQPGLLVNRIYPALKNLEASLGDPASWESPFAKDAKDFLEKKRILDQVNLRTWQGRQYSKLPYVDPSQGIAEVSKSLAQEIQSQVATP
ncbi:MAG: hypothetical protein JNL01_15095 [Bdellovibrionales bacterium]|nr:hypothetical protein [Bdellovibrionales bacterium]